MNYLAPLGRVFGNLRGFYSGINGATLTGAIDVVVVEQEDGSFKCSPFHVRFGKLGVLRSKEKVVEIEINGVPVPFRMKLGDSGEAFFVQEIEAEDELDDDNLATSPLPGSPRELHFANELEDKSIDVTDSKDQDDNAVVISIEEEEDNEATEPSVAETVTIPEGITRVDETKSRKRRKKRKKNQGSKSDVKLDLGRANDSSETSEPIFKMDEDISSASEALKNLDVSSNMQNRSYHRDFFSDTEVEATNTPPNSRPGTPIQSDSEYEISKTQKEMDSVDVGKWAWGELPSTGNTTPTTAPVGFPTQSSSGRKTPAKGRDDVVLSSDDEGSKDQKVNKSMLAGMFSFMNRNQKQESGDAAASGIYLQDLNLENMDPEVAALYFPNYKAQEPKTDQDEDGESGKGSSLPQSPAPGSSPKISQIASDMEQHRKRNESSSSESQSKFEAISLCGNSLNLFDQSQLSYDDFIENPEILLSNPPESIVVKIDGKYVPWAAALPQLLSTTFFRRPLPQSVYQKLIDHCAKKDETQTFEVSDSAGPGGPVPGGIGKEAESKKTYSWFPWRRSQNSASQDHSASSDNANSSPELRSSNSIKNSSSPDGSQSKSSPSRTISNHTGSTKSQVLSVTSSSDESEEGISPESKMRLHRSGTTITMPSSININSEKYKKSLRLTSDQIQLLGLRYGQNEAVFSVTTAYQGTSVARCHIYLWKYDDRVVVSDIDGTITKSDVLGHILPIIGNDWAQSGVAQLFTQIHDNGYKMLYLSARAIGQAQVTREYLRSIRQGDVTLPDGPLLLNPTSLMAAFHREVIEKKPEEFKIACLKDIQTLFPRTPFYAGYGNRINDVWSYRAVDINISRIFTINHKGELRHALTNTFQSSYTSLTELAEHIFPAYKSRQSFCEIDGFNTFEFWRQPIPSVAGSPNRTPEERVLGRPRSNTVA